MYVELPVVIPARDKLHLMPSFTKLDLQSAIRYPHIYFSVYTYAAHQLSHHY